MRYNTPQFRGFFVLLLAGCLGLGFSASLAAQEGIVWEKDINSALAKAKESNRLVFVHFYGDNCPPCRAMESEVFTNKQVIADMNRFFVSVKVDTMLNPQLVKQFEIKAIPADVVLKSDGQFVHRRQGGISAERFDVYLNYINGEAKPKEILVAQQPAAPPKPAFEPSAPAPAPVSASAPVAPPVAAPVNPSPNPWGVAAIPVAPQAPTNPPQVDPRALAATPMPILTERHNPVRQEPRETTAIPPTEAADGVAGTTVEIPLALDGFCPVTLSVQERWQPGNPLFYAMYRGQIFRCANEETLETFIKDPAKYAPVAMGEDIVQMVERNKKVVGQRKFGAWFQNRVFLFSSQESLDSFAVKPAFYAEIALKYETALRTRFDSVQR